VRLDTPKRGFIGGFMEIKRVSIIIFTILKSREPANLLESNCVS